MISIRRLLVSAVFAALICAGWMITIPLGPIPLVLQNALAILAGLILGPIYGSVSVLLFLLLGALGLPVFAGGNGGAAVFAGPTGGFLVGYFFAAIAAGAVIKMVKLNNTGKMIRYAVIAAAAITGVLTIYLFGLIWFKHALSLSWQHTVMKGFVPFILPDIVKAFLLVPLTVKLLPIVHRYLA